MYRPAAGKVDGIDERLLGCTGNLALTNARSRSNHTKLDGGGKLKYLFLFYSFYHGSIQILIKIKNSCLQSWRKLTVCKSRLKNTDLSLIFYNWTTPRDHALAAAFASVATSELKRAGLNVNASLGSGASQFSKLSQCLIHTTCVKTTTGRQQPDRQTHLCSRTSRSPGWSSGFLCFKRHNTSTVRTNW